MAEGLNGFSGFLSDFVRGTTIDFQIVMSQDGSPIELTGAKFYITFAQDLDTTTAPDLSITISTFSAPATGVATGQITDTQTLALAAGVYYYSVRYVTSGGATYVIDFGTVEVFDCVVGTIS